jgi:serine phosphatase RsbU (regulator of sigma subunit)
MAIADETESTPSRVHSLLFPIARQFWPELNEMTGQRQLVAIGDVITFLTGLPLALIGLAWLAAVTDLGILRNEWMRFLLFGALIAVFSQVAFFLIIEIRADRYGSADGSLVTMLQWAAVLLFGPTALWLLVIWSLANFAWNFPRHATLGARWGRLRGLVLEQAGYTLTYLPALAVYRSLGGTYPIAGLHPRAVLLALIAILVQGALLFVVWSGYVGYAVWTQRMVTRSLNITPILRFILLALGLPLLSHPFAVLAAGLYVENGVLIFLFFISGLLLVAYLTRWLSQAAESSRQQSRQLEKLEQLSRAILDAPLDASALAPILKEHVPAMFPSARVAIWLEAGQVLFQNPPDWKAPLDQIEAWLLNQKEARAFLADADLPWEKSLASNAYHDAVVVAPILEVESGQGIGGVYLELRALAQPWDLRSLASLFPAVHSLAAEVASALHQALVYAESLDLQRAAQELMLAGRIQASFLPIEMPNLDGWELAVTLLPARETSGDYFDFIPLSDGRIGILMADVADKGVGAALYMALSRTLIRTYALEFDAQPDVVFFAANERVLEDAHANLFVTAFYGILDPLTGELVYANAGHNPPYLFSPRNGNSVKGLSPTGMPIGVQEEAVWTRASLRIEPGDVLVIYTDGIPDALNNAGQFFKEKQLVEVARLHLGKPAQDMQTAIVGAVQEFVGSAQQFDDITLLVLKREG